jgi:shikimate dehydrogenase
MKEKGEQTMETNASLRLTNVLFLAQEPAQNPSSFEEMERFDQYTVTPINHEYPGMTPAMWNAVYREFGLNFVMAMMVGDPINTKEILEVFRHDPKYLGGGSGVGFKDEVPKFLDEMDPLAQAIGSVNLIQKLPDGRLKGWNTDGIGYVESLEQLFADRGDNLQGKKIVMLGAGGTGMSVAFALAEKGADLVILNRTVSSAQALSDRINVYVKRPACRAGGESDIPNEVKSADVVLNASSKGERGPLEKYSSLAPAVLPGTPENLEANHQSALRVLKSIPKGVIVSDVVLRKKEMTPLISTAKEHGFITLDGVPMVVNQAIKAFMIIHGREMEEKGRTRDELEKIMRKAAGL